MLPSSFKLRRTGGMTKERKHILVIADLIRNLFLKRDPETSSG